jgi:hypothetical protein
MIGLVGEAFRALVPVVERAHIPWKQPDAYDDWDEICRAVYRSIVIRSVECAGDVEPFMPLLDYDVRVRSYAGNSFIAEQGEGRATAFVCFETLNSPFDQCLFAELDEAFNVVGLKRVAAADTQFVFCCRRADAGTIGYVEELNVLL